MQSYKRQQSSCGGVSLALQARMYVVQLADPGKVSHLPPLYGQPYHTHFTSYTFELLL
jgi:hypothetical protein